MNRAYFKDSLSLRERVEVGVFSEGSHPSPNLSPQEERGLGTRSNDRWHPQGRREFLSTLIRRLLLLALALFSGYLIYRRPLGCRQRSQSLCQQCVLLKHCRLPARHLQHERRPRRG
jgi:hypothetical protein